MASEKGSSERIDLIYLAGSGRTGSTLIERILETYDGVASAGEFGLTGRIVTRGNIQIGELPCPCGQCLQTCPHWSAVFAKVGFTESEMREFVSLQNSLCRARKFPVYFVPILNRGLKRRIDRLAVYYARFYRALAEVSNARVIVDASNQPFGALILKRVPGINLFVKHLVRRPEAVAFSWMNPKRHEGFKMDMATRHPFNAALRWLVQNLMAETLRLVMPVRRYRYEWFVENPRDRIAELTADVPGFGNLSTETFQSDRDVIFPVGHALLGNPDRFKSGVTHIRRDDRYRTAMKLRDRLWAVIPAWPLLLLYGYAARR